MDQYIKRKIKYKNESRQSEQRTGNVETEQQIILREGSQQLNQFMLKLAYFQKRISIVRKNIEQLQAKIISAQSKNSTILANSSMQKSQIKNQLPDRKTLQSNATIQTNQKLDLTQELDFKGVNTANLRQNDDSVAQKLQQSSKGNGKIKKIRKRI